MEDDAEFLNYTAVVRAALQFVEYMVKVFVRRPTRCSSYPTSAFERPRRNVTSPNFSGRNPLVLMRGRDWIGPIAMRLMTSCSRWA